MTEEYVKSKNEEMNLITKELKNHYILNEFFIDPQNNFLSLLERIIVIINKKAIF